MPYLLLALLICLPPITQAEIYKWVDEKGIHFADEAPAGVDAETVIVQPPNSSAPPSTTSSDSATHPTDNTPEQDNDTFQSTKRYSTLNITHPNNDQAIRSNGGNVLVTCSLTPPLQADAGHQVRFILDGQAFAISSSCSTTLEELDRGIHYVSAEVVNQEGLILLRSDTTKFNLQRHSSR
ncbi:MAG: hypothetical protein DSZ28_03925 [Thiothrix sp.]|nr:MAG: hypothetical protein DSZ28_03925 [Thiothrix sp.]